MKLENTLSRTLPVLPVLLIVSHQAVAGTGVGSITHAPIGNGVPVMGGAGLIVLSALLGLVSLRFLKERGRNASLLVVCVMAGALVSAGGGLKLISEAQAIQAGIGLTKSSGGSIVIPSAGFNTVTNLTSGTQEITDISLADGCSLEDIGRRAPGNGGNGGNGGTFRGTCDDKPGTVLDSGDFCDILICCDLNGGGNGGCFD